MSEMEQKSNQSGEDKDDSQREPESEPTPANTSQPAKKREAETTPKNWREVAAFSVSFGYVRDKEDKEQLYTGVKLRGGKVEQWPGVAANQLIQWMATQTHLPLLWESEPSVEVEPLVASPQAETALEITDLWISEVRTPALTGKSQGSSLLRAEGHLNLSGGTAYDLTTNQLPFNIEFYLVNTQTHESRLVATQSGQLRPGELGYEIHQDFPIPAAGRYQLYAVARLLTPDDAIVHLQGPIIRVEN